MTTIAVDIARLELATRMLSGLVQSEAFQNWANRWADGKDRSESRIDSVARVIHQTRETARMESRAGTPVYDAALACLRAASQVAALEDYERAAVSFASRGSTGCRRGFPNSGKPPTPSLPTPVRRCGRFWSEGLPHAVWG